MTINEGFLFFKDWESSMRGLSKKDFFALFWAMYDFQMYGKSFPEFSGKAQLIASFVEPQLKRRIANSQSGTRGAVRKRELAEAAAAADEENSVLEAMFEAEDDSGGQPPYKADIIETEKEKNKIIDSALEESENVASLPRAESGEDYNFGEKGGKDGGGLKSREDGNVKTLYGKRRNVVLTHNERGLIRATIPNSDEYIDMFSEKLYSKGYSYSDHCEAILKWWEKDQNGSVGRALYEQVSAARQGHGVASGADGCSGGNGEGSCGIGDCYDPNDKYRDLDAAFQLACKISGALEEE